MSGGGGPSSSSATADQSELARIMADVMAIKEAEVKADRARYEALPACVRHSLFAADTGGGAPSRDPPFSFTAPGARDRLAAADELAAGGKQTAALRSLHEALWTVWRVELRAGAPHWRAKGIRDEHLDFVDDVDRDADAVLAVAERLAALEAWEDAAALASRVLKLNAREPRALRVRAAAARERGSEDAAFRDLTSLLAVAPDDAVARATYDALLARRSEHARRERDMFGGKLARPGAVRSPPAEAEARPADAAKAADELAARGFKRSVRNPTGELKREAERLGLDLSDPGVQAALDRMTDPDETRRYLAREREKASEARWRRRVFTFVFVSLLVVAAAGRLLKSLAATHPAQRHPLGDMQRVARIRAEAAAAEAEAGGGAPA